MGNRPFMPGSNLYGPSENIWGNVPVDQIILGDRSCGFGVRDDFIRFSETTLTDGYIHLEGGGCSVAQIPSVANHPGIVRISMDGTADDEGVIQLGNGLDVGPFDFLDSGLAFEAYVRFSANGIVTTVNSCFLGLATGGAAGAGITDKLFVDDDTNVTALFATIDCVGFLHLNAMTTELDAAYQVSGSAEVDGAVNTDLNDIHTIVTDGVNDWVKVGMLYVPHPRRLAWFIDGVEVCHIDKAALDNALFPDATFMTPTIGIKIGAGAAAVNLDIDWMDCMQITCW